MSAKFAQRSRLRLLTGDTPTGPLHLGHYVGSLENRLRLQDEYECYFILANKHAFTTQMEDPERIKTNVLDVATDWLAVGIDPKKSAMFVQSEVHEIDELTFYFAMLLPFNRVMRNPTLKEEILTKGLGDSYPFGFPLYSVGQTADILAFRPEVVPVGKDQLPHIEMTREVARRFNTLYCGVGADVPDERHRAAGGLFGIVKPMLGRVERLVGTGGPGQDGQLLKMSKSLNNAILLSDTADVVRSKVMGMYTDPTRARVTDPGNVINNPVWIFHEAFNKDVSWVSENRERYRLGGIGDVEVKRKLVDVLNDFLEPIRKRRSWYRKDPSLVITALRDGTKKAQIVARETMRLVKQALKQQYW